MDLVDIFGFGIDLVVAGIAIIALCLTWKERVARKRLEAEVYSPRVTVESRIIDQSLNIQISNQSSEQIRLTRLGIFLNGTNHSPTDSQTWATIFDRIGLTRKPEGTSLDIRVFSLPQTIPGNSMFQLVKGEFQQDEQTILSSLDEIRVKISMQPMVGEEVTKSFGLIPV